MSTHLSVLTPDSDRLKATNLISQYGLMEQNVGFVQLAPRASYQRTRRGLVAIVAAVGILMMLVQLASAGFTFYGAVTFSVLILATGLLPFGYVWLWPANTRLLIGPGVVGYQDLFWRRRLWSTSDVERAVELTIQYPGRYGSTTTGPVTQALLLVDFNGRCLCKVRERAWMEDDINAFVTATGRQLESAGGFKASDAARQFPGSVGWMYAHPQGGIAVGLGIFLGLAGFFEIWVLISR